MSGMGRHKHQGRTPANFNNLNKAG
jgi:hypothetical protein